MIRHIADSLGFLAALLATKIAPDANTEYAVAQLGLVSGLLMALAQESERAVATRLEDVAEIRELLPSHDLPAGPKTLHLQDVSVLHAQALRELIQAHAWAEEHDPELDAEIWAFLRRSAQRHAYSVPGI